MVAFKVIHFIIFLGRTLTCYSTLASQSEGVKSYEGYKLLRTANLPDGNTTSKLMSVLNSVKRVDFWTFPKVAQMSDILVSPNTYSSVKKILHELNIDHRILQENIAKLIEAEKLTEKSIQVSASEHSMDWTAYHRYEDFLTYYVYLASSQQPSASGAVITIVTIGATYENQPIYAIRLRTTGGRKKKAIWLDGGMHGREWISPATVTYILNTLVTDKEKSAELLEYFDWYIIPVVNVDGYKYSWSDDRMWSKTRSRSLIEGLGLCRGADPNRNFAYKWGGRGILYRGPCSDRYIGDDVFSESESIAVRDGISRWKDDIVMYLSFHSYSQRILVPWSGDAQKPADYQELYNLAVKGQEGIRVPYGTEYKVETAPDANELATGRSADWAKSVAGIKYSYIFELRGKGTLGYLLPPNQIIPSGIETFNGVKAMALALKDILKLTKE